MADITIEEVLQVTQAADWRITLDDAYSATASCVVGNYDFIIEQRSGIGPIYPSIELIVKNGYGDIVYEESECSYSHGPLTELMLRLREQRLEHDRKNNQAIEDRFKNFVKEKVIGHETKKEKTAVRQKG